MFYWFSKKGGISNITYCFFVDNFKIYANCMQEMKERLDLVTFYKLHAGNGREA